MMKLRKQQRQLDPLDAKSIEGLVDEHEYSRIVLRSIGSIRRDRVLGRGCRYVKIGNLVRYRLSDIREYIDANVVGAQPGTEAR
jgi:hypothetical protein